MTSHSANINVHTAAVWTIVEIFKDESLLSRVRMELKKANFESFTTKDTIDKLLLLPLLQSIYAEVLRLRVEVQQVLGSDHEDIQLTQWRFPKKSLILVPTLPAHMDHKSWNTRGGKYPLNVFWSDRFLTYSNDPLSGPINKMGKAQNKGEEVEVEQRFSAASSVEPKFKENGTTDFFIPYGVGERACPGRFFARREIVAFCAIIVNGFDVELLTNQKEFKSNETFYGLGTQRPLGCIPFRIRKRKVM